MVLLPPAFNCGDRVFCHSAHTRPSVRGEKSLFLQEDHMLNSLTLSFAKISTAAGRARNCTKPLRRRERKIATMSMTGAAIEDRMKMQISRAITVRNRGGIGEHLLDPGDVRILHVNK